MKEGQIEREIGRIVRGVIFEIVASRRKGRSGVGVGREERGIIVFTTPPFQAEMKKLDGVFLAECGEAWGRKLGCQRKDGPQLQCSQERVVGGRGCRRPIDLRRNRGKQCRWFDN